MDVGPSVLVGGAGGGLLLDRRYDGLKGLIGKSVIHGHLFKEIVRLLDSYCPLVERMQASNEELDLPMEVVRQFEDHLREGKVIVCKCSKVSKWNIFKKVDYANKLLIWKGDLERLLKLFEFHALLRRPVTEMTQMSGIQMSGIPLESGVEILATTSRHMEEALSGVEMRSGDVSEGMYRIEDRVEINSSNMEAGINRIQDRLDTRNEAEGGDWCAEMTYIAGAHTEVEMCRPTEIALSGVENISGHVRELIDQVDTSSRSVEARFKRIDDRILYCSCVILFLLLLVISVSAAGSSPGTKVFLFNIGVNTLINN